MPKIVPKQTVLHETDRYEAGQEYDVSEELASYFSRNGWLEEPEGIENVQTLEIHDSVLGQKGGEV